MAATQLSVSRNFLLEAPSWAVVSGARALQAAIAAPALLYMATLGVMLFRPPDLNFYHLDQIAFGILVFCSLLRALATGQRPYFTSVLAWPMLAMLLLALATLLQRPYEAAFWATFAARWLVPFALYHLAQLIFQDAASLRHFETFCLIVLTYLAAISIAFLAGAHWLIFPRFILDEGLGIHADRARGPFLQAVANGVTLNLLGLVALNAFRRGRLRGWPGRILLACLPIAILATETRSVWLAFCTSIFLLAVISRNRRLRRAVLTLVPAAGFALVLAFGFSDAGQGLTDRFKERSPVEFRESTFQAGWGMFLEKPLWGWNANDIQPELSRRISDFRVDSSAFHNSYVDVAVSNGAVGLGAYLWMFIDLLRLGRRSQSRYLAGTGTFLDGEFRALWPVLVAVYVINASFVLMHYQFVNALLFTLAGMLAAQNRRAAAAQQGISYV